MFRAPAARASIRSVVTVPDQRPLESLLPAPAHRRVPPPAARALQTHERQNTQTRPRLGATTLESVCASTPAACPAVAVSRALAAAPQALAAVTCAPAKSSRRILRRLTPYRERLLLTGGAGHVAGLIAPRLRAEFRLRWLDIAEQEAQDDDELVEADIRDVDAVVAACADVSAIVHLAAQPAEADFRSLLLPQNLDGTWAVFDAAVVAGVPRIVFASTVQTVDGNPLDIRVSPADPPRPVSVYGCTKLFGEALGRFHSDNSGIGVACIRLGAVVTPDEPRLADDERFRNLWCGPEDLARLMAAAIRSDVPFAIVIAVSPPATNRFDTVNPFGWTPVQEPTLGPH